MSPTKKKKSKGRPPKYVLDENGREITGLSYNPTNEMYYITGSSPRQYIKVGNEYNKDRRKKDSIRLFKEWKKNKKLAIDDDNASDDTELLKQARRLIEEGFYNDLVENKARDLIAKDLYTQELIIQRALEYLSGKIKRPLFKSKRKQEQASHLEYEINRMLKAHYDENLSWCQSNVEADIKNGNYDSAVNKRAYEKINRSPIDAAYILGLPGLIFVKEYKKFPLTWDDCWHIFYVYKDKKQYLYECENYYCIKEKMSLLLSNPKMEEISFNDLKEAFEGYIDEKISFWGKNYKRDLAEGKKLEIPWYKVYFAQVCKKDPIKEEQEIIKKLRVDYLNIPPLDRLEILEDVFLTVENAGFPQSSQVLKFIRQMSKEF